jgi:hypothetical protein
MNPRKSFPLRLSPELYQAIEAWAHQDMRSVNGQIEFLLKEAVCKRRGMSPENLPPIETEPPKANLGGDNS